MAICDAFYRFTWIDIGDYGSVSDVSTFQNTDLYKALEANQVDLPGNGMLPRSNIRLPYFFVADPIFALSPYLMKPYARNERLTERQRVFNYRLSRARNSIEDSFGILTSRWQILNNRLDFQLETSTAIVKALICLHNFVIGDELPQPVRNRRYGVPLGHCGNNRREHFQDEMNVEFENEPINAVQQREMLTIYFNSPQGQLRN